MGPREKGGRTWSKRRDQSQSENGRGENGSRESRRWWPEEKRKGRERPERPAIHGIEGTRTKAGKEAARGRGSGTRPRGRVGLNEGPG